MGVLKPTPNAYEIPVSPWGSCSEQPKEPAGMGLSMDVHWGTALEAAARVSSSPGPCSFPAAKAGAQLMAGLW